MFHSLELMTNLNLKHWYTGPIEIEKKKKHWLHSAEKAA